MTNITPNNDVVSLGHEVSTAAAAMHADRLTTADSVHGVTTAGVKNDAKADESSQDGDRLQETANHCDCSELTGRRLDLCTGQGHDGRPAPRQEAVDQWRANHCQRETVQNGSRKSEWNPGLPSRGLGDSIAKVTHAIGLDAAAESIAKAVGAKSCGCKARQAALNRAFPYTPEAGS